MWFSWKLYKICKTACRQRAPYCLCIRVKPCVLFLHTWKIDDHKICLRFTNFWQKHVSRLSMPTFGQTRAENTQTWNKHCSSILRGEIPASYRASAYKLCVLHWPSAGTGNILSFCLGSFDWQLVSKPFLVGFFESDPCFYQEELPFRTGDPHTPFSLGLAGTTMFGQVSCKLNRFIHFFFLGTTTSGGSLQ